jgi:ADP-ribosyl-[dinitrogen reductase] hydrolase
VGDSLGSYLEFKPAGKRFYDEKTLNTALSMPGGGHHKLAPGQATDDTEMAICLMHALVKGKGNLNLAQIVKYYGLWNRSKPFDIGNTTRATVFKCDPDNPNPERPYKAASKTSESNGALMRITPLAVWSCKLS